MLIHCAENVILFAAFNLDRCTVPLTIVGTFRIAVLSKLLI